MASNLIKAATAAIAGLGLSATVAAADGYIAPAIGYHKVVVETKGAVVLPHDQLGITTCGSTAGYVASSMDYKGLTNGMAFTSVEQVMAKVKADATAMPWLSGDVGIGLKAAGTDLISFTWAEQAAPSISTCGSMAEYIDPNVTTAGAFDGMRYEVANPSTVVTDFAKGTTFDPKMQAVMKAFGTDLVINASDYSVDPKTQFWTPVQTNWGDLQGIDLNMIRAGTDLI